MNGALAQFRRKKGTMPLPEVGLTRSGIEFDPNANVWAFRDGCIGVSMNFDLVPEACRPLLDGLKRTLLWYLENRTAGTARTNFDGFLSLARFMSSKNRGIITNVTEVDILNFKASAESNLYVLSTVRAFLVRWAILGAPGIDGDLINFLKCLKLKQRPVGVAVCTLDTRKGPFTDLEFESIQSSLNGAFARGEIGIDKLLLCYLFMSLGARPSQLASLKCSDLIVPIGPSEEYYIRVPRVKQQGYLGRTEFKIRRLAPQIGVPLASYTAQVCAEFAERVPDSGDTPMFPQRRESPHGYSRGFEFHQTAQRLAAKINSLFKDLRVMSDRLGGEPIPVNPLRFRRTFATRAAEEGWPILVLAELMDHTNTRNVEIYTSLTSRIRASFSRKIAMDMAPLADAFGGKVIHGEPEARRPGTISRIVDLRVDKSGSAMGSCASNVHCGFARPLACYAGCHEFEPWLNGPHEEALAFLLERRARLVNDADLRIAAINDRAILGCAQVILRCAEINASEAHG